MGVPSGIVILIIIVAIGFLVGAGVGRRKHRQHVQQIAADPTLARAAQEGTFRMGRTGAGNVSRPVTVVAPLPGVSIARPEAAQVRESEPLPAYEPAPMYVPKEGTEAR